MDGERTLAPLPEAGPRAVDKHTAGLRPNIVFVLADDMGYGDLGALNFGASQTPRLDSLMREGTFLTQCYAGSAVCTPSRASLMTGRYPHRTGAIDTMAGLDCLAQRERTMADLLSSAGYATGLVGKWHLGWDEPGFRPAARGFAEAAALERTSHWQWILDYNGRRRENDGQYLADVLTDDAVSFIRRHRHEPFFLYLAHFAPHNPPEAPEEDIQPFRDAGHSENVATIYGMIRRMDRGIGRVLDELQSLGLEENTLVIFASDNGPMFGTSWTDRSSTTRYNAGFHGHKDLVYEGGIRVPAILRWPAGLPASQTVHDMVHFNDWLPTLLDVAGVETPHDLALDGRSIVPILRGEPAAVSPRLFWQYSRFKPVPEHNAAVRDGAWKLVRPCLDDVTGAILGIPRPIGLAEPAHQWSPGTPYIPTPPDPLPPQLFNLAEDPQELHDLSAVHPDRMSSMLNQLDQWFESVTCGGRSVGRS